MSAARCPGCGAMNGPTARLGRVKAYACHYCGCWYHYVAPKTKKKARAAARLHATR